VKNLKVLLEWFPLVALITSLGEAARGVPRVHAALQVLRFVAAKTDLKQDDQLVQLFEAILLTEQGRALVDYLSDEINKVVEATNHADK
jgi:hypothetical protein